MTKHKNIRILAIAIVVLTLTALLASCGLTEDEKHIAVESSVLIKGKEETTVTVVLDSTDFSISLTDENVAKMEKEGEDAFIFTLTPIGEGTTQIVVTTADATYKKDIKVYKSTLSLGLQSLVIGMGTVFAALIVLWIILAIFGKVAKAGNKKTKEEKAVAEAPTAAPVESEDDKEDEAAIVAAIVAAISAYTGKDASSFKVVSFKRKSTIKSWNQR